MGTGRQRSPSAPIGKRACRCRRLHQGPCRRRALLHRPPREPCYRPRRRARCRRRRHSSCLTPDCSPPTADGYYRRTCIKAHSRIAPQSPARTVSSQQRHSASGPKTPMSPSRRSISRSGLPSTRAVCRDGDHPASWVCAICGGEKLWFNPNDGHILDDERQKAPSAIPQGGPPQFSLLLRQLPVALLRARGRASAATKPSTTHVRGVPLGGSR